MCNEVWQKAKRYIIVFPNQCTVFTLAKNYIAALKRIHIMNFIIRYALLYPKGKKEFPAPDVDFKHRTISTLLNKEEVLYFISPIIDYSIIDDPNLKLPI